MGYRFADQAARRIHKMCKRLYTGSVGRQEKRARVEQFENLACFHPTSEPADPAEQVMWEK